MAKELKCYQKRTKKCVMGWIRELEIELGESKVPRVINEICIQYVGGIDDPNKICICGYEFKRVSVSKRLEPSKLLCTDNYQYFFIECDFCGVQIRCDAFIQEILYCDRKSKLHRDGVDKCYPKCQIPHQNGRRIRGWGNCLCRKCKR